MQLGNAQLGNVSITIASGPGGAPPRGTARGRMPAPSADCCWLVSNQLVVICMQAGASKCKFRLLVIYNE